MMKKSISAVFTALFMLFSLIPLLGLLLFGPQEAAANERLHARPVLTERDGSFNEAFLNDLSDYFADHFALRREASALWARLNAGLLHSSVESQVLLGDDGWLYFSETLDDYTGQSLPAEALGDIANNLRLMQESLSEHGAEMLFVIAPNKSSLYGEYMPGWIENRHADSNAAKLFPLLTEQGVRYADLFTVFSEEPETLYYRTDSHWNARGAALAADAVLQDLGRSSSFFERSFSSSEPHLGDLYEMLYPGTKAAEDDPVCDIPFSYVSLNDPRGGEAITIHTENASASGTLYCWRDSFGNALYPWLAESFGSAVFSRSVNYDLTGEELLQADTVILEIVERNLPRLWSQPALFPAPLRTLSIQRYGTDAISVIVSLKESDELLRCTAVLSRADTDPDSEVYFTVGTHCYAACRCSAEQEDCFSMTACLPAEEAGIDGIAIVQNGVLTQYPIMTEVEG